MAKGMYNSAKDAGWRVAIFDPYMNMWKYFTRRAQFSYNKKQAVSLTKAGAENWVKAHPNMQAKAEPIEVA